MFVNFFVLGSIFEWRLLVHDSGLLKSFDLYSVLDFTQIVFIGFNMPELKPNFMNVAVNYKFSCREEDYASVSSASKVSCNSLDVLGRQNLGAVAKLGTQLVHSAGDSSLVLFVKCISLLAAVACLHHTTSSHRSPSEHAPRFVRVGGIQILS
jgi:hypothetical protein